MMKKILLWVVGLLFVAAIYLNIGNQPTPIPSHTQSAASLEPGPYKVRKEKVSLLDTSRATQANGDYQGSAGRELDLFFWVPSEKPSEPQPLLVYSHGFMSNGEGGEYLAKHLASHGYTVAAATFPLTNYSAPGGANPADVVNQPADVSFIIDQLLAKNADAQDLLFQRIDPTRIAAAGMSLGGLTTALVAFHPELSDERIAAAISIAGPAYMFSKRFFEHRSIPFMMVASPQDALVNYQQNAANILAKVSGATLVTVENGSHIGFSGGSKWLRWMDNPDSLGCDAIADEVPKAGEASWYDLMGTEEMGLLPEVPPIICAATPMPKTMNPLRQLQLTSVAVSNFLNCQFGTDKKVAPQSCDFLTTKFAQEIPEVSVSR